MPTIKLPGMREKSVKEFAHSVSGFIRLLKRDGFATGAGDNGAINVWKDKDGALLAERYVYQVTRNKFKSYSLNALREWLKVFYPQIL